MNMISISTLLYAVPSAEDSIYYLATVCCVAHDVHALHKAPRKIGSTVVESRGTLLSSTLIEPENTMISTH